MRSQLTITIVTLVQAVAYPAAAEETPEFPGPAPEHALLKRFVGAWKTSGECPTGPDSLPTKNRGKMVSRMLGDRWVVNEITIEAGETEVVGVQTIGYDPIKKQYVGTWTDSMTNHLWVYEGRYEASSKTLILEADGPNLMTAGETTRFRDTYRFVSEDQIESTSEAQDEDGEWVVFMTGEMNRHTQP